MALVVAWGISIALAGEPPQPAEPPIDLTWTAPPTCPDRAAVGRDIDTLLTRGAVEPQPVDAEGRIEETETGYRLQMRVRGPGGESTVVLGDDDCTTLARAAALIVAVSADPLSTLTGFEAPTPEPGPARPASEPIPPPAKAPAPPRRRHRVGLAATGGVGLGFVPAITGGVDLELGWLYGPARLAVHGVHWFARTRELSSQAGIRAALSGGGIRGCFAPAVGPVELPICTGVQVGAWWGGGAGTRVDGRAVVDTWVGLPLGAGLDVPFGSRFALRVRFDAVVGLRRPAFHLVEFGERRTVRAAPVAFGVVVGGQFRGG